MWCLMEPKLSFCCPVALFPKDLCMSKRYEETGTLGIQEPCPWHQIAPQWSPYRSNDVCLSLFSPNTHRHPQMICSSKHTVFARTVYLGDEQWLLVLSTSSQSETPWCSPREKHLQQPPPSVLPGPLVQLSGPRVQRAPLLHIIHISSTASGLHAAGGIKKHRNVLWLNVTPCNTANLNGEWFLLFYTQSIKHQCTFWV